MASSPINNKTNSQIITFYNLKELGYRMGSVSNDHCVTFSDLSQIQNNTNITQRTEYVEPSYNRATFNYTVSYSPSNYVSISTTGGTGSSSMTYTITQNHTDITTAIISISQFSLYNFYSSHNMTPSVLNFYLYSDNNKLCEIPLQIKSISGTNGSQTVTFESNTVTRQFPPTAGSTLKLEPKFLISTGTAYARGHSAINYTVKVSNCKKAVEKYLVRAVSGQVLRSNANAYNPVSFSMWTSGAGDGNETSTNLYTYLCYTVIGTKYSTLIDSQTLTNRSCTIKLDLNIKHLTNKTTLNDDTTYLKFVIGSSGVRRHRYLYTYWCGSSTASYMVDVASLENSGAGAKTTSWYLYKPYTYCCSYLTKIGIRSNP